MAGKYIWIRKFAIFCDQWLAHISHKRRRVIRTLLCCRALRDCSRSKAVIYTLNKQWQYLETMQDTVTLLPWRAPNGVLPCRWYVAREHDRWPSSRLSGYRCLPTVHQHQSPSAAGGARAPSRSPVSWWSKRRTDSSVMILPGIWTSHETKESEPSCIILDYEKLHLKWFAIGEWPWRLLMVIENGTFEMTDITSC